jgi:ABC-2 type transport system ATP-binding protein
MSVLEMTGVEKSYGNVKALDGVDLKLDESRFVGLLGPNGAGKSTLFQIISGLFVPDAGSVKLFGMTHASDGPEIRRRMGVVFQARSVDLDMTIRANLRFHGRLFGLGGRKLDARIDELAEQFDLTDLVKRPVRNLSGGQQRKVEIARALLNDPRLLVMDEPTAGLDAPSRRALVRDMRDIATDAGVAILWATHLVDEIEGADRVILLTAGTIVADTTPEGLKEMTDAPGLTEAYAALTGAATPERE